MLNQSLGGDALGVGDVRLDRASLILSLHDREHRLTRTECAVLEVLMRHADQIVSIETIERAVWPRGAPASRSLVAVYICNLRKLLEGSPAVPRRLISVFGQGYMLLSIAASDSVANPPSRRRATRHVPDSGAA
jgi:DNA-binding response OmpR family regulator